MVSASGIAVRDTILWVEDTGEKNLPPILCLHSLFVDGTMFDELVQAAAGRFRVIRPDFRAQGSSAPSTNDIVDMQCCADDMVALIETMGLSRVHVAAASMGGDVSVRMAAQRPELIQSMVMMGSSVRAEPPGQKADFSQLLARTFNTGFVGEDLDMLMAIMFGETTHKREEMKQALDHWRAKMRLLPRATWAAMYGVLEREDASPLLKKIKAPSLIINGEEDIARPPPWAQEVVDGIKGAELIMLEGVGHSPILERPDFVIPRMLEFFESAKAINAGRRKSFLASLFA